MSAEKLLIRNISSNILDWLKILSDKNERSLESEARNALTEYVEARAIRERASTRAQDVGQRLTSLLAKYNESYHSERYSVSKLAVTLGADLVEPMENFFMGVNEAPISQLKQIANVFMASEQWLIHGKGTQFITESYHLPRDPFLTFDWFTEHGLVKKVYLVRCDDEVGSLCIVKVYGDEHNCKTFITSLNVSNHIGASGEADLCHLFLSFELLCKYYYKAGSKLSVYSYLLPKAEFNELCSGSKHPMAILKSINHVTWWEDIWDKEMSARNNHYWNGWTELVNRIYRATELGCVNKELIDRVAEAKF